MPAEEFRLFLQGLPVVIFLRIVTFYNFGIYKNLWKYISVRDLMTIISACTTSSVLIVTAFALVGLTGHSRSIYLIDWLLSISLIGGSRLLIRFFSESLNVDILVKG